MEKVLCDDDPNHGERKGGGRPADGSHGTEPDRTHPKPILAASLARIKTHIMCPSSICPISFIPTFS